MRGSGEGGGGRGDEYRYMFGAKTWKDTVYGSKISEEIKITILRRRGLQ